MKLPRVVVDFETNLPVFGYSYNLLIDVYSDEKSKIYRVINTTIMCSVTERRAWIGFRPMWRCE